ncbi:MAG TPA: phosphatase PAP2 family protein [Nitrososphaeraceae archaeon]|jgi:hypothetical protein|nr:phosphatase PAP2 family protein [Nitrososphaeraceae archaeon]
MGGKKVAVIMASCMIILGSVTKDIIKRPRPLIPKEDFIPPAAEYAFPSGLIVSPNAASDSHSTAY